MHSTTSPRYFNLSRLTGGPRCQGNKCFLRNLQSIMLSMHFCTYFTALQIVNLRSTHPFVLSKNSLSISIGLEGCREKRDMPSLHSTSADGIGVPKLISFHFHSKSNMEKTIPRGIQITVGSIRAFPSLISSWYRSKSNRSICCIRREFGMKIGPLESDM